jgi:hypothetical protein
MIDCANKNLICTQYYNQGYLEHRYIWESPKSNQPTVFSIIPGKWERSFCLFWSLESFALPPVSASQQGVTVLQGPAGLRELSLPLMSTTQE